MNFKIFIGNTHPDPDSLLYPKFDEICKLVDNYKGINKAVNEAIFILEREKKLLQDCLKGWKSENHLEAFKQRNKKLKEINNALEILK